ncbi:MAG: VOC family protein [Candidatus Gracilibacteria bacterium]
MQKITPFLWFDDNAEEAMDFYMSVFKNAKEISKSRYPNGGPMPAGTFMTGAFELEGLQFTVINAGPAFKFNESISFVVECKDQEEVDYFWDAFTKDGGEESQCGWLKDKFGLSWQIAPTRLLELISGPKASKVMPVMMTMKKIDLQKIEDAANS